MGNAHLRGLCRNLIHPLTEVVQIPSLTAARNGRRERQHLSDLPADRGPHLRGRPVPLDVLTETKPCLQGREDSSNDDRDAPDDPDGRVQTLLKRGENTRSHNRCKHHYRDAQSHV